MDFPQPPQGATGPMPTTPSATPPTTPPAFPNVPQPQGAPVAPPSPQPVGGPVPLTPPPFIPNQPQPAQIPVQIPVQAHVGEAMSGDEQVYTMPDKFLNTVAAAPTKAKKSHKGVTIVLIVAIVLMVLAIAGGALYYFMVVANQATVLTNSNDAVVVNDANTTVVNNADTNVNNTNLANDNLNVANTNVNNTNSVVDNTNVDPISNANANANTNTTTNTANVNVNSDLNANANVNATTNTNTTSTIPEVAKDTDEDSLTNDEEKIWGTQAELPDSDNDGYTDGVELLAGYDPTNAKSSGRLADNAALVTTFSNTTYGYTVTYPINWLGEALNEGDMAEVLFTPNTLDLAGQFIAITITENPAGQTALDWYVDTANVADETTVETITSFAGVTGVTSADGMTVYYADATYVYAISYRYGSSDELFFPSTFTMVAKSFTHVQADN